MTALPPEKPTVVEIGTGKAYVLIDIEGTDPPVSGGGTGDHVEPTDAKIAAAEARVDTKFAQLRGDLKDFATAKDVRNNVWGAAATILAILLAAIAFGGDRFDAGIGMADVRQAQIERDAEQDAAVKRMDGKLDQLIERTTPKP